MWGKTRGFAVLGVLAALGAAEADAQARARPDRALRRGPGVEAIMRMRDRLELTDEQVAGLEEIRREGVERRADDMAQMAELRSRLEAGQIEPSELMAFREERREADREQAEARRERIEAVLDQAQLETLREARGRARAFARGRTSARRGPGGGWNRGRPGLRGPRDGFGRGRPGRPWGGRGVRGGRFERGPGPGAARPRGRGPQGPPEAGDDVGREAGSARGGAPGPGAPGGDQGSGPPGIG